MSKPTLKLIVNPNPPQETPTLQNPTAGDPVAVEEAIQRLEKFLENLEAGKILEPLQTGKHHPVVEAFIISWTHDIETMRAIWMGRICGMRASMKGPANGE